MPDEPNALPSEPLSTKEFFRSGSYELVDAEGRSVGSYKGERIISPFTKATAERLAACYNFCAGIPILERMSKPMFKRQALNNAACKDISEEVLLGVIRAGGFGKIIQGLMQQKFPDYEGHWEQQFLNDSEEPPDAPA